MDRRAFLYKAGFFVVATAAVPLAQDATAGTEPDDEDSSGGPGRYLFPQGVVSGDPKSDSVVFWTRCWTRWRPNWITRGRSAGGC